MKLPDNVKPVPYAFEPRDYQLKLFQALDGIEGKPETRIRYAILKWHRRAGKDKASWCYLLKEAYLNPGNYFYVFPVVTQGDVALWKNVDKDGFRLMDHLPEEVIAGINNNDHIITLKNNSTIKLIGSDIDPQKIRGAACKGVVFSEAAYCDPTCFEALAPSIRQSKGWCILNSTPQGRNHFSDMFRRNKTSPKWYCSELQTMWSDRENYSGLVPPNEIKEIQEEEGHTDQYMAQEYGVDENAGITGSFYIEHVNRAIVQNRIGDYCYDDTIAVDTFWDLGYNDSTTIWFRQRSGNKILFIDYYENSKKDLQHYVRLLKSKGYDYGTHHLPHDGAHHSLQTGITNADMLEQLLRDAQMPNEVVNVEKTAILTGINASVSGTGRTPGRTVEGCRECPASPRGPCRFVPSP